MSKKFFCLCLVLFSLIGIIKAEENQMIVCDNGMEMFEWDLDFIKEANHSIEFAACFAGGQIFDDLLDAIEARLSICPELQVHILTTPTLLEKSNKERVKHLSKTYPNNFHIVYTSNVVIIWPDLSGIDNHVKMLVVDETYYAFGGTNYAEFLCTEGTYTPQRPSKKSSFLRDNLPSGVRDQDIVGRGQTIAKQLRQTFYKLYALWETYSQTQRLEVNPEKFASDNHYFPLDEISPPFAPRFESCERLISLESDQIKLFFGGPHQKKNDITAEYVRLIKNAKREIAIHNMYFCPVKSILNALMDAVNRGVKLTVISNGISDVAPSYTKFFCWANRMSYVPMFYGSTFHLWDAFKVAKKEVKNTKIYEYNVRDVLLHKKAMIIDDQYFVVGSYNIGSRSDLSDYEMIAVIDSQEIVRDARKVFDRDIEHSVEISPKKARKWYFDPFYSYLGEVQKKFHGLM